MNREPRQTQKRPSFGIRTTELTRSQSGFGFTLSGQEPCILSSVARGTPAERVGLKPGDHVIAVNGRHVANASHDEVVHIIGNSTGVLRLQIAENYNCSSSDNELDDPAVSVAALRQGFEGPDRFQRRNEVVMSDEEDYMGARLKPYHIRGSSADSTLNGPPQFEGHLTAKTQMMRPKRPSPRKRMAKFKSPTKVNPRPARTQRNSPIKSKQIDLKGSEELHMTDNEINSFLHPSLHDLRQSLKSHNNQNSQLEPKSAIFKAVVGYLGTIEMPEKEGKSAGLSAIRNCIRRLRVEKKVHTMVLLCVLSDRITLINHHGMKLAEYPGDQIAFCGTCESDTRFFGLVTNRSDEENPNSVSTHSCHVFLIEDVSNPLERARRAQAFQFKQTITPDENGIEVCEEFPTHSGPIIEAIMSVFGTMDNADGNSEVIAQVGEGSPNNSNSDSGIGFKDEANQPHVVPLPQNRTPQLPSFPNGLPPISAENRSPTKSDPGVSGRLDVRAMPNPKQLSGVSSGEDSFNAELLDAQNSAENLRQSMQKYLRSKQQHLKRVSEQLTVKNHPDFPGKSLEDVTKTVDVDNPISSARFDNYNSSLAKYMCSSDSNISQVSGQAALKPASTRNILKPCDQYPSEPGVLRSSSGLSGAMVPPSHNIGHGMYRPYSSQSVERSESLASHPEENYDDLDEEEKSLNHPNTSNDSSLGGKSASGWSRNSSIRKHLSKRSFSSSRLDQVGNSRSGNKENDIIITDEKDPDSQSQTGNASGSERGVDVGRVGSWATDFGKLLSDPVGLQTFTEFLKKEFSAENIMFWVCCEKYRKLTSESSRHAMAINIMEKHLSPGASEPVNVDSIARQSAQDGMADSKPDLFAAAQKQIYNLMKFDSFSRFLKSDLYKNSLVAEMSGKSLPFEDSLDPELFIANQNQLKSSGSRSDNNNKKLDTSNESSGSSSRRKSLLPWGNLRSKSKERPSQAESKALKKQQAQSQNTQQVQGEKEAEDCTLARVILPDKATTVVQTRHGETIRAMVSRLLEKRGLKYTSFDVFATNQEKPMDLSEESTILRCTEVRVEPRVLFRLELPSKKSIGVKAKPAKIVRDVLGPILLQYGWNLDSVMVRRDGATSVSLEAAVASIDNSRLIVSDLNSRIMEDVMRFKRPSSSNLEDTRSNSSRGSSASTDHGTKFGNHRRQFSNPDEEKLAMPPPLSLPPKKSALKLSKSDKSGVTEELYEGIKMAQRGRLDDQRGTEINFEMPDFLKRDKENFPRQSPILSHRQSEPILHRPQHQRRDVFPSTYSDRLSSLSYQQQPVPHSMSYNNSNSSDHHQPYSLMNFRRDSFILQHGNNESTFSHDGFIPSNQEADNYFRHPNQINVSSGSGYFNNDSRLSLGFDPRMSSGQFQDATYETLSHYRSGDHQFGQGQWTPKGKAPPPLPPKPRMSSSSSVGGFMRPSVGSEADLPMNKPPLNRSRSDREDNKSITGSQQRGYSVSFV